MRIWVELHPETKVFQEVLRYKDYLYYRELYIYIFKPFLIVQLYVL